jgi:hypothetical protein
VDAEKETASEVITSQVKEDDQSGQRSPDTKGSPEGPENYRSVITEWTATWRQNLILLSARDRRSNDVVAVESRKEEQDRARVEPGGGSS